MTYERKPGDFSLFKNTRKTKETQPDYTGEGIDLSGSAIRVAAWKKTDRNGSTWLACRLETPRPKDEA